MRGRSACWLSTAFGLLWLGNLGAFAQSPTAGDPAKLAIVTTSLPLAMPGHAYRVALKTSGGIPPMRWELANGILPGGMTLSPDGVLMGTPTAPGQWRFTVGVSDASRPQQTASRELVFQVNEPLLVEWRSYAHVTGDRISGSVAVSNGTEDDFDFTLIVVAVSDIGKAFALGYQHFSLSRGTTSFEIPFGQTVPRDTYIVHVDAVGEVPAKRAIYRGRLETREKLSVTVGP